MFMIDVVIPTHVKDSETIELCIEHVKKNVMNLNKVYIVSKDKLTDNAEWIPESDFPFSLNDVIDIIGESWKTTWYYQQVLKFYVHEACEDVLDDYLIVDSDTMMLRPIDFVDEVMNVVYFNWSISERCLPYYEHMGKLIPTLETYDEKSGVTHSMVFSRDILNDMKGTVESIHSKSLWEMFLEITLTPYKTVYGDQSINGTGRASEYEIYFNYARRFHPDRVKLRQLNSILAYKGQLFEVERYHASRTNKFPSVEFFKNDIDFEDLHDSFRYVIDKSIEENYDSVTFQKHSRQNFEHYKSDSLKYLKENANAKNK